MTLQEKDKGKVGSRTPEPPQIEVSKPLESPRGYSRLSPPKYISLASKFSSPISESQADYNQSLPLPSDADTILKSPDVAILNDQFGDDQLDYGINTPAAPEVERTATPPPKKLSFLERILQTQRNSHKGEDVKTPERDPMEIHRINNDVFMINDELPQDKQSATESIQSNKDAGVIDEFKNSEIKPFDSISEDISTSKIALSGQSNVSLTPTRVSMTPTQRASVEDPFNYPEDHQNDSMPMTTPSPPRTEFNDNFSPSILVDNEYTIDPDSGSDNEISKLLNGQNENPVDSAIDNDEHSGLRSPILLPPRHNQDQESTRIIAKSMNVKSITESHTLPLSMIRNIVKSITSQAYGLDYPATKKRRGTKINKSLLPIIQDLSSDFLSGVISDLVAYLNHRKSQQIAMKDVNLYTQRLNSLNNKLGGNRIPDSYTQDSIMLLAQKFLPLETLNELQTSLRHEGIPQNRKRKFTEDFPSESWLLDSDMNSSTIDVSKENQEEKGASEDSDENDSYDSDEDGDSEYSS